MEFDKLIIKFIKVFDMPLIMIALGLEILIKDCMLGTGWGVEKTEKETKEENKEEVKEEKKKINIDKDLQKYFNYKE